MSLGHFIDTVVKQELENVFGAALTARIIMASRAKANAPIVNMKCTDCEKVIDEICADDRVCGLWGQAGSAERKARWKSALRKFMPENA